MNNVQGSTRIAVVSPNAFSLRTFRGPLMAEMVRRGATVYALAPDLNDDDRAHLVALGTVPVDFDYDRAGTSLLGELKDLAKLTLLLRRLKLDLVLSCVVKLAIYGTLAGLFAGVPRRAVMIEGLGYAFTPDDSKPSFRRRALSTIIVSLLRVSLRFADTVFLLNQDDWQFFLAKRIGRPKKLTVINGTGVDLEHFASQPVTSTPMSFVLVARLLREKGVYEFVEAAQMLSAGYPEARFRLVGGLDTNPGSIRVEEITRWHDDGLVDWVGQVNDIIPVLTDASVFVLPSWREGAPRSTQEALALGRPVITTDVPGARDTVVDGHNGFIVPARKPEALAAAMRRFLDEPGLIEPMGKASRALAESRYDERVINAEILATLEIPEQANGGPH